MKGGDLKITKILLLTMIVGFSGLLAGCQTSQTVTTGQVGGVIGEPISAGKGGSDQERYDSRLKLAFAYYQGGAYDTALSEVDRALELRPRSGDAIALKGMIYGQMGDTEKALGYLKTAASLDASNGDLQHNLGTALCNYGRNAEGIAYLEKAAHLPSNTNKIKSWLMIGTCYKDAGNVQKAETAYHQVLYMEPNNMAALGELGNMMFMRNDIAGAQEYLGRIGSMSNMNASALWLGVKLARQQGDAYLMGQYAKALRDRYPSSPEAAALNRGDYHL